jgi:universal stress protein A
MGLYKKILVAVDFSDANRLAVEHAVILARLNDCEIILLNVIEHFPIDDGPLVSVFQYNPRPVEILSQDVQAKFKKLTETLDCENARTEFRITSKSARNEILRFAKEHEVDLIVVAPHGQGVIGSLGSTATGVLNNAECDVLAVRNSDGTA